MKTKQPWYSHYQSSTELGEKAQGKFALKMMSLGYKCIIPQTYDEKTRQHIDFYVSDPIGLTSFKVDVKAHKNVSRQQEVPDNEYFWVQFVNQSGFKGWIYSDVDFIVMEYHDKFLFVKPLDLQKLAESLVNQNKLVHSIKEIDYCLYARYQDYKTKTIKKERTSKIRWDDIRKSGIVKNILK